MSTLYQKLGCQQAINGIIDKYFEQILSDSKINPFYENKDILALKIKYKKFFTMITGGPENFEGKNMKNVHEKVQISSKDFENSWVHFQKAMKHHKIEENLVNQMKKVFYSLQKDIVVVQKEKSKTLFERMGGQACITAVVDKFYEFILNDPVTGPFFNNTDMKKLAHQQKQFITMITGGPNNYKGLDMKTAHHQYKIGKKELDQFWHNLEKALNLYKVSHVEVNELKSVIYSLQGEVVQQ